jgi:hypothetical protein
MTQRPETVLIYSCGETIGDGLFKLPFLVDLRARFPDAKITWLAGLGPSMYAKALAPVVIDLLDEVIEDDIRDCERGGDFGPTFIELARAVYRTNDRRAAIKKEINLLLGSALVEEKSYKEYLAPGTAGG